MILSLVLTLLVPTANANSLSSFQVFANSTIQSQKSDYQGSTGALGAIQLSNFEIVGDLASRKAVEFRSGSVRGAVRAPKTYFKRTGARRSSPLPVQLDQAGSDLVALTTRLNAYRSTSHINGETIEAHNAVEVIDLESLPRNLFISGRRESLVLVRVHGTNVDFKNRGVFLIGNMRPEQITFFFPEAATLELSYSGGPEWGVPGSVVAPYAKTHFAEILVTGRLYVGSVCTNADLNGGQVNAGGALLLDGAGSCNCQP